MMNKPALQALMLDVDSTLYACNPIFLKYLALRHNLRLSEEHISSWDFWRDHGLSLEQWLELIENDLHSDEEISAAIPYPGAIEALQAWAARGVKIHVVSARHDRTRSATEAWLRKIGVPFEVAVFDFEIDKLTYARDQRLDLIIDDKPSFLIQCAKTGWPAASIRYAYNAQALQQYPQLISAADWPQLRNKVEKKFSIGAGD